MEWISYIAEIFTLFGISIIGIWGVLTRFFFQNKVFGFDREAINSFISGYIEPMYDINKKKGDVKLTKRLKTMIFGDPKQKMIFIIGKTGSGKTNLVNRFIWKYNGYVACRKKKFRRIYGIECMNIIREINDIDDKENVILIIDGLDEAFTYNENNIKKLKMLNDHISPFYSVIITVNQNFYDQNRDVFQEYYYRNTILKKVLPCIISLKPFHDEMIIKYITRNIKTTRRKKKELIRVALKNKALFSNPLMLHFVSLFDVYEGEYTSQYELLEHIFHNSIDWQKEKVKKRCGERTVEEKTLNVMNQISVRYLKGARPVVKSRVKIYNALLVYNNQSREYRFRYNIFLYYNTVRKFYNRIPQYNTVVEYIYLNKDFRRVYFDKIFKRHYQLTEGNDLVLLQREEHPVLVIKSCIVFERKWLLGLTKSLLRSQIKCDNVVLDAGWANEITKKLLYQKYLSLQGMNIDENQISWWSKLSIETLNISDTKVQEIVIPVNWFAIRRFIGQNISLNWVYSLQKLTQLEELDLSGVNFNKIHDLQHISKLPDRINLDLSNCGISDENIPQFLYNTVFDSVYLDYNRLQSTDFIKSMKFSYLNISNNPVIFSDSNGLESNVVCDYYFKNASFAERLCNNRLFLSHAQARRIQEIDISDMKVDCIKDLRDLPQLKSITINIFQLSLLAKMDKYSSLEAVNIKTYCLNQLLTLGHFYSALNVLFDNEQDYKILCPAIKIIMDFTVKLLDYNCHLNKNMAIEVGVKKLANYMNVELGVFYRNVVDAFNCAVRYWKGDIDKMTEITDDGNVKTILHNCHMDFNEIAKRDYEQKLVEVCSILHTDPVLDQKTRQDLYGVLQFFYPIRDILKSMTYSSKEVGNILSKQIGKKIEVAYIYPNGSIYVY